MDCVGVSSGSTLLHGIKIPKSGWSKWLVESGKNHRFQMPQREWACLTCKWLWNGCNKLWSEAFRKSKRLSIKIDNRSRVLKRVFTASVMRVFWLPRTVVFFGILNFCKNNFWTLCGMATSGRIIMAAAVDFYFSIFFESEKTLFRCIHWCGRTLCESIWIVEK